MTVKERETILRSCCAEIIGFASDEFVKIILVDSAFICLLQNLLAQMEGELEIKLFQCTLGNCFGHCGYSSYCTHHHTSGLFCYLC